MQNYREFISETHEEGRLIEDAGAREDFYTKALVCSLFSKIPLLTLSMCTENPNAYLESFYKGETFQQWAAGFSAFDELLTAITFYAMRADLQEVSKRGIMSAVSEIKEETEPQNG
jgi:hypothetical protein